MQINILKQEKGYIKFNIRATDPHTLFNLLREELLKDTEVDFAGYWRDESFYESVVFQVKMKKKTGDPVVSINSALERLEQQSKEFVDLCKAKIE
ncbi:MAG: DNA-directed RNA polymerase subunit L [Candidatus Heimdallarchaeota archaeon AB_125]|nr:MAG: DNA-directed RNA polymerase subunit L [Candidatus Heimdallarchaeota archaeon AB_125]